MNCAFHNESPAVATCQSCSVGLCNECIDKGLRIDNKPACKKCSLEYVNMALDELNAEKSKIKTRKIIWTIILVLGLALAVNYVFLDDSEYALFIKLIPSFFVWGFAGFWDRVKRNYDFEKNQSSKSAMSDALFERDMYKDGSIFIVWAFKLCWVAVRGIFFPIFYVILMIWGEKEINEQIAQAQEQKAALEA